MGKSIDSETSVAQQAFEWFDALRDAGAQERMEFTAWLKASPRHVGEFLAISSMYREYSGVDPQRLIDVEARLAEPSSNVVPLDEIRAVDGVAPALAARRRSRIAGIAASLLVVSLAIGAWVAITQSGSRNYANAVGEIRSFELSDGSVIHLNTASTVQVRISNKVRAVHLLKGEALFKVARDPARPFRVHSGKAVIQALGTQFNVYKRAGGVTVSVLEGAVRVASGASPARDQVLDAGQGARVASDGEIHAIAAIDTTKVIAWQQRHLIFRDNTLEEITAEFNRYNETPRFRIEGTTTGAMRFTGVFDAEAPESFIRVLGGVGSLSAERQGDEVVIREKRE